VTLNLPQLMEALGKRPQMFVQPVSFATVQSFLTGLATGLDVAGIKFTWEDYHAAAEARGWDPRGNIGILRDFTRKGLSDAEMIQELIAVHADAYARAMARADKQEEPGAAAAPMNEEASGK
jgi:hypothetical protein